MVLKKLHMGRTCHYCGARNVPLTRDHIIPRGLGGTNANWNIVPSCVPCNQSKANAWPTCGCATCRNAVAFFSIRKLVLA